MKTFGLIAPSARGGSFGAQVQHLLSGDEGLTQIVPPLLEGLASGPDGLRNWGATFLLVPGRATLAGSSCPFPA